MAAVFALVVALSHAVATFSTAIKNIVHRWGRNIKEENYLPHFCLYDRS
jgi:hypothetical protein